jgi:hypothetical protein
MTLRGAARRGNNLPLPLLDIGQKDGAVPAILGVRPSRSSRTQGPSLLWRMRVAQIDGLCIGRRDREQASGL